MSQKLRTILYGGIAVVGVLIIGAYIAMDYATNYVLRSISTAEPAQQQAKPASPSSPETGTSPTRQEEVKAGMPNGQPVNGPSQPANPMGEQLPAVSTNPVKPEPQKLEPTGSPGSKEEAAPGNEGTAKPLANNGTLEANITPEQAKQAQEEITLKEKAKVTSVLLSKLSASDLSLFIKMSQDGVSVEEKKEAKKIILQKLTEEEYNELIAIAAKLGLSASGKSYQDSLKEK